MRVAHKRLQEEHDSSVQGLEFRKLRGLPVKGSNCLRPTGPAMKGI